MIAVLSLQYSYSSVHSFQGRGCVAPLPRGAERRMGTKWNANTSWYDGGAAAHTCLGHERRTFTTLWFYSDRYLSVSHALEFLCGRQPGRALSAGGV